MLAEFADHESSGLDINKWSEFEVGVRCVSLLVQAMGRCDCVEIVISKVILSSLILLKYFGAYCNALFLCEHLQYSCMRINNGASYSYTPWKGIRVNYTC